MHLSILKERKKEKSMYHNCIKKTVTFVSYGMHILQRGMNENKYQFR